MMADFAVEQLPTLRNKRKNSICMEEPPGWVCVGVAVLSKRDYNDYISEMIETNKCWYVKRNDPFLLVHWGGL